ncbi:hypothetical protein C7H19_05485 [Aphanothece hegewaldii CCALA 016]|uniref:DUF928 domain-containing protein n=1 Tax=Aphanothece hegewaldii CCALA 016 TaxID=2107694 RepID=A0A2T1M186_9CHRO|nr:DUF928 domain-containing protein [Aphanothece hegewaldii]PSF38437.1 hypothetical protein C7H19_05485 [Aphanothece hegewaldii CCALA 016]
MSICLFRTHQRSLISLTLILTFLSILFTENGWTKSQAENRQGWPTRRVGGGSRGCSLENIDDYTRTQYCRPLIALISEGLTLTTQSLPSLWFYFPFFKNSDQIMVEFVLRDEADQLIYEATFKPTTQQEITSFQLSQTQTFKGLAEGKAYHWYLSVIYKATDRAHDDVVEGWVQRVPLRTEIAQQLRQATPLEKVRIYQEAHLWPEAIAILANLKQMQPNDPGLSQLWEKLIASLEIPSSSNSL